MAPVLCSQCRLLHLLFLPYFPKPRCFLGRSSGQAGKFGWGGGCGCSWSWDGQPCLHQPPEQPGGIQVLVSPSQGVPAVALWCPGM